MEDKNICRLAGVYEPAYAYCVHRPRVDTAIWDLRDDLQDGSPTWTHDSTA